ncbi:MAG: inorganic phosphate transporter [Bacteroidia bacterium]
MLATLGTATLILLILCLVAVFVFEFVNGFHDTANAVATVIYTGTLKPLHAVLWSGLWNFLGVIAGPGGIAVAMKIVKILPVSDIISVGQGESIALVLSVLFAAIIWNIGTWYMGIPCSSSHTLIGSLLGAGYVFSVLHAGDGIKWEEATKIMMSLLISPAFGFAGAVVLMFILRQLFKRKSEIFEEPKQGQKPPIWIRAVLITTCTLVSFFHGSNDGQKGVGLTMIILMIFLPMQFGLAPEFDMAKSRAAITNLETQFTKGGDAALLKEAEELNKKLNDLETQPSGQTKMDARKKIQKFIKRTEEAIKDGSLKGKDLVKATKSEIKVLKDYTEFAPFWVVLMISIALGIGTTIGWKRIVVTIGEKIGKRHMTYAEGATAELMAATTIGLSTQLGLPVSTTHVLSSGVAGSMTANKGVNSLEPNTIKNIGIAWILTLPVTIILAGGLYYLLTLFI